MLVIRNKMAHEEEGLAQVHQLLLDYGADGAKVFAGTKLERQCLDAAAAVMSDERFEMNLLHSGFALTALPHRSTKELIWQRTGGHSGEVTLHVESGFGADKQPYGIPYGSIARLILIHLSTEAVRNNSRVVELGSSMRAFLKRMGVTPGGKTFTLVRDQSRRISMCRLTFFNRRERDTLVNKGSFVKNAVLVDGNDPDGRDPFQDTVELDDAFFESLKEHPLPLRESAIKQLAGKSTALDLYVFLSYRLHVLPRATPVSWKSLYQQFGAGCSTQKAFVSNIKDPLTLALAVYPEAKVEVHEQGLILHPSDSPVPKILPRSANFRLVTS